MKTKFTNSPPITSGTFYHVYNRAVGNENLFFTYENYSYFIGKFNEFLSSSLAVYSYCLLPNHFHYLVRTNGEHKDIDNSVSEQFRRLFITYSQAINKQESRMGSLFMKPFKRKEIENEQQLFNIILYIHNNPIHHKIIQDLNQYQWSSYPIIISHCPTNIKRDEVINLFNDFDNFKFCHVHKKNLLLNNDITFEQ